MQSGSGSMSASVTRLNEDMSRYQPPLTLTTKMLGLIGRFRQAGLGIYRGEKLVHRAPPPSRVSHLMDDLLAALALVHKATFRANYLKPALASGLIEMTDPDSPRSPAQRYRLTETGERAAALHKPK
jgi:hypothetical protein